jgi:hypothetical protein
MHKPQLFILPMVHPPLGEVIFSVSIPRKQSKCQITPTENYGLTLAEHVPCIYCI